MSGFYEEGFKKKLVYLHIGEARSIKSLAKEYNISHSTISIWCKNFRDECKTNPQAQEKYNYQKEILKLNTHLAEVQNVK